MSENKDASTHHYTEAPASWNVKYYQNGYDCMLTLRASTGKELFEKVGSAMTWLQNNGSQPNHYSMMTSANLPRIARLPDDRPVWGFATFGVRRALRRRCGGVG